MGSSLVPRTSAASAYRGSREVRAVQRHTALALASEGGEADLVNERLRNGFQLAHYAAQHLAILNRTNTELSHDNPGLELSLRVLERSVTLQAADLITGYMGR